MGLLVVHGIGAQAPGETVEKLANGLRLVDSDFALTCGDGGLTATIGGQPLRLYEVYWADLLLGDPMRGAFQMKELQSLSWFPWFNLRRGSYPVGRYSFLKLAFWCLVLPVLNFFVLFTYYGVQFLAQVWSGATRKVQDAELRGLGSRIDNAARQARARTGFDELLDEYVGDVLVYVNSAGRAFYREDNEPTLPPEVEEAFPRIVQRFHEQLIKAHSDGCATIQIVAHSLGTVVSYHALTGFGSDRAATDTAVLQTARRKVTRVYTIGSPLEKVRFFWPRITPASHPDGMKLRWDNFVSLFDPVSGPLRSFENWGKVNNHRLLGGGFVMGHLVYEHSPVFLGALTEGLCGRPLALRRTFGERVWDLVVLVGETLLAPAFLVIVIALGAGFFVMAAALVPFMLSWTVRWFLPPETWAPVIDTMMYVLLGMMVFVFFLAPALRASKVHALYWTHPNRAASSANQVSRAD